MRTLHGSASRRLLDPVVEHAPESFRDSMCENVPLCRDIAEAWDVRRGVEVRR